uniref:Membrane protein ORF59 n=1 Tax=Panagrellus redivivus TaxID=6233 RepID=A0A7E4VJL2_PANRE
MVCLTARAAAPLLILLLLNCCWLLVLGHDTDDDNNNTTTLSPNEDEFVYVLTPVEVDVGMIMTGIVIIVFILAVTACVIAGCVIAYFFFRKKRPSTSATLSGSGQSAANPACDV